MRVGVAAIVERRVHSEREETRMAIVPGIVTCTTTKFSVLELDVGRPSFIDFDEPDECAYGGS